jgi:hypothetical protein
MRYLSTLSMFTFVTLTISGCSGHSLQELADKHLNNQQESKKEEIVSPTKNEALTKVSPLNQNREDGAMQKSLDSWLDKVWTPTVQKDEKIKNMDQNNSRNFTLQEYVDKAVAYSKNTPDSNESSNIEKISKLPVIGK